VKYLCAGVLIAIAVMLGLTPVVLAQDSVVTVEVLAVVSISVTPATLYFTIDPSSQLYNDTITAPPSNITVENTGNVYVNVTVSTNATSADIFTVSGHAFEYLSDDNEAGSCTNTLQTSWTNFTSTGTQYVVCNGTGTSGTGLNYADSSDSVVVALNVSIGGTNEPAGVKPKAQLTFTATQN